MAKLKVPKKVWLVFYVNEEKCDPTDVMVFATKKEAEKEIEWVRGVTTGVLRYELTSVGKGGEE